MPKPPLTSTQPKAPGPATGPIQALEQILLEGADFDPALTTYLAERFIPLRFTGVSSRIFSHWRAEGLIDMPELPEGREREPVRLSAPDYLYVKLLSILRYFGMPLEALKEVKQQATASITKKEYVGSSTKKASNATGKPFDEGKFLPSLEQGGALAHLLLMELATLAHIRLHVFANGYCLSEIKGKIAYRAGYERLPRIVIDFSLLVSDLALTLELIKEVREDQVVSLLSPNERRILEVVREGRAKSVTIHLSNNKAGADAASAEPNIKEPIMLEFSHGEHADSDRLHKLVSELRANPHAKVEIRGNGQGQKAYAEITQRERLPTGGNRRGR